MHFGGKDSKRCSLWEAVVKRLDSESQKSKKSDRIT